MALRNVASNFTFEQQRVEINEIASDLYALETGISTGNATLTGYLRGPASFTIDPATHGDNTGTVVISGNLTVNGTTTTINSTTLSVDDKIVRLGDVSGASNDTADGGGIVLEAGGTDHSFLYNKTDAAWVSSLKIKSANGFEGDGSQLTNLPAGPAQAAIANNADNRVITGGSGVNLNGEANLTFDGNNLIQNIDAGGEGIKISAAGNHYPVFTFDADRSAADNNCGQFDFKWNGTGIARIATLTGDDTTNKDNGYLTFHTSSAGTLAEALRIASNGDVLIGSDTEYSDSKVYIKDTSTSNYRPIVIDSAATDGSCIQYLIHSGGNTHSALRIGSAGANNLSGSTITDGLIRCETNLLVAIGNSEKLRITSTGQLVVGNNPTVDSNTFLHVERNGECNIIFEGNNAGAGCNLFLRNNSTSSDPRTSIGGLDASGQGTSSVEFWNLSDANNEGEMRFSTRPSGGTMTKALTIDSTQNATFVGNVSALAFDGPTNIPRIDKSSAHTIVAGDAGHCITAAGTITLPANNVMTQGDVISIYNASAGSTVTIDAGGCTMNHAGVGAVTTLTLADMGLATVWWIAAGTCVISGSGLS